MSLTTDLASHFLPFPQVGTLSETFFPCLVMLWFIAFVLVWALCLIVNATYQYHTISYCFFFLSQRYTQFVHTQGLKDSQCIVFAHHRPSAADTTRTQLRKMTCYLKISICFLLVARHSDLFSSVLDCRSRGLGLR